MESEIEAKPKGKLKAQTILLLLVVVILVALTAWGLVTVSNSSQVPPSDFVTMPTTQFSTTGDKVLFASVSDVAQKGLAVGVQGDLRTVSGAPVTQTKVYITYYADDRYRTQVTTTDQNGHFEFHFPINWDGWLPVTLTYFGDGQHQGLAQTFQVAGESD